MTLPPHKIGDKGQPFMFYVHGGNNLPIRIMFSRTATYADLRKMQDVCDAHPEWHTPFILDRNTGKVVRGACLVNLPPPQPFVQEPANG